MLESMFLALGGLGVLFMVLAVKWKSLTISIVDTILWLVLSIAVYSIERPYQYTLAGEVYATTQVIESMWMLSWFFLLLCLIMMLHTMILVFDMLKGRFSKVM